MSASSIMQKMYPEAEGYWRDASALYTRTPTVFEHLTFTVKPVAEVGEGALVILPDQVPSVGEIAETLLLWCKVEGKIEMSGETDVMVQIIAGRESAPDTEPLPETPGLTFKRVRNLLVPSKLLISASGQTTQAGRPKAKREGKVNTRGCARVFVLHGKSPAAHLHIIFLCIL
jgi:hypothetical protein